MAPATALGKRLTDAISRDERAAKRAAKRARGDIAVSEDNIAVSEDSVTVPEDNITVPEHGIAVPADDVTVTASDSTKFPEMPISATSISGDRFAWALNRQDLCEASPYFKAYQSGLYSRNRVAIGVYIGKYCEPRDFLYQNELVVNMYVFSGCRIPNLTSANTNSSGGSRKKQAGKGDQPMIRTDKTPPAVGTWKNSIGLPVVVIIG